MAMHHYDPLALPTGSDQKGPIRRYTEPMVNYNWKPIKPLSEEERKIDLAAVRPLYENWRASKNRLQSRAMHSSRSSTDASFGV